MSQFKKYYTFVFCRLTNIFSYKKWISDWFVEKAKLYGIFCVLKRCKIATIDRVKVKALFLARVWLKDIGLENLYYFGKAP